MQCPQVLQYCMIDVCVVAETTCSGSGINEFGGGVFLWCCFLSFLCLFQMKQQMQGSLKKKKKNPNRQTFASYVCPNTAIYHTEFHKLLITRCQQLLITTCQQQPLITTYQQHKIL